MRARLLLGEAALVDELLTVARLRQRIAERIAAAHAEVVPGWPGADVVETVVVDGDAVVAHVHPLEPLVGHVPHRGVGELGPAMACDALARAGEDGHAGLLVRTQGCGVAFQEPVDAGVVGDQGGLVELDRQPEEEREVGLHLVEARIGHHGLARLRNQRHARVLLIGHHDTAERDRARGHPVSRVEGLLDQGVVRDQEAWGAWDQEAPGQWAQHAVVRRHHLLGQWHHARRQQLVADLREGAVSAGHLERAARRPHRLGGQAPQRNLYVDLLQLHADQLPDVVVRVPIPEGVGAVEVVVGPPVPEVAEVIDGVDHGRRVARFDPSHVHPPNGEAVRVGHAVASVDRGIGCCQGGKHLERAGRDDVDEVAPEDALRRGDVVGVEQDG